ALAPPLLSAQGARMRGTWLSLPIPAVVRDGRFFAFSGCRVGLWFYERHYDPRGKIGPHPGCALSLGRPVSGIWSLPSGCITNTWRIRAEIGLVFLWNAIQRPFGDQSGSWSTPG